MELLSSHAFLLLAWAVVTSAFIYTTRNALIAFVGGANLALGLVVYRNCRVGMAELGGLPEIVVLGLISWGMSRLPVFKARQSAERIDKASKNWQTRRLLVFSLLGCGLTWGCSIAFLVLPKAQLHEFLRSIGGENLPLEGATEYAVRMVLAFFTIFGFFLYSIAAEIDANLPIIRKLGGCLIVLGVC